MHNNEELQLVLNERYKTRNVKAELGYCSKYIKDRRNISKLDLEFYMWLFGAALRKIEALERIILAMETMDNDSSERDKENPEH